MGFHGGEAWPYRSRDGLRQAVHAGFVCTMAPCGFDYCGAVRGRRCLHDVRRSEPIPLSRPVEALSITRSWMPDILWLTHAAEVFEQFCASIVSRLKLRNE